MCPNLLSPKFVDAQMSSNFLPKFFVLKYIEPKVLGHKFLDTKVGNCTKLQIFQCLTYFGFVSVVYVHLEL